MTLTRESRTSVALALAIFLALTAFVLGTVRHAQASVVDVRQILCFVDQAGNALDQGTGTFPVFKLNNCGSGSPVVDWCPNIPGTQGQADLPCTPPIPPTDVCPNIEGMQEIVPAGMVIESGACVTPSGGGTGTTTDTGGGTGTTTATSTDTGTSSNGDAGSSGTGSSNHHSSGSPSTTTQGEVLGASTSCSMYLTGFMQQGAHNDSGEVAKLQEFLNTYEAGTLRVSGVYDAPTLAAVNAFQRKYAAEVLAPWGLTGATGRVYYTTQKQINSIYCKFGQDFPLSAAQLQEMAQVRALQHAPRAQSATGSHVTTAHATTSASTPVIGAAIHNALQDQNSGHKASSTQQVQTAAAAQANASSSPGWFDTFVHWLFGR